MKEQNAPGKFEVRSVYEGLIDVIFNLRHESHLKVVLHPDFLGYGTAAHEFFQSLEPLMAHCSMQAGQMRDLEVTFTRKPVMEQLMAGGAICLIVEEFEVYMKVTDYRLPVRLSVVLEKTDGRWWIKHMHASTPDPNIDERESLPMEGLRKKNEELEAKIEERTRELQISLENLKATQAQLIQSEKMASLGELTAGIAHEIQNPLNFVNNFSEVSAELVGEMLEELANGDPEEARAIAADLRANLDKIVHHGKRADGIVKGMLQHSRTSDGKMEPTDLNALVEEYFRLAYHGLRAKDKSFNAAMETDLDPGMGLISIIPQDIGRVILNLVTNAFHAVNQKTRECQNGYAPTVTLRTTRQNGQVVVSVLDNGNGIPEEIRDKIFQPFFTTKPTGQGTGLGLSLSYDIVKAEGGEIVVTSTEGKGTEFTIKLPAS
ncbi:MAG TPA: ATP-binding protein [Robiginitalea sp.]|nr:ATP-binding protein [Robiginitalea sp.]